MLKGTNQELARPFNRRIVLETIRRHGPISRAEVARRVGLTAQTVSTITSELRDRGFVKLLPGVPKGRGFPAPLLEINPDGGFACGVYVTPRGIEAGIMNLSGDVLTRKSYAAHQISPQDAFDRIASMVGELSSEIDASRMIGVGLALPGPFDIDSMSFVGPTTLEGWSGIDVSESLSAAVDYPAFVEWDSAAAARGEILYGIGEEIQNFYYLYMGVGLGGCAVCQGQPMRGAWGNAGEIGHIPLVPDGDPCPCGNRGCLERYLSLEAYERRREEVGEEGWLREVAPIFRSAIVMIENLFDPEVIVLGGLAPVELCEKILELSKELPNSVATRNDRRTPRVVLSRCAPDAVLRGAASLAVSRVFSPGGGNSLEAEARAEGSDLLARLQ
ncbi:ROK family transcriptional regulator [Actibacterium sp. MT2.3-13A]|uniref:ROK family transcriptional regulator n=1 Tax=Actibacterium sp. MT2.3-13A TaxID=2828332 RepID=UPI001BA96207|nr:ROK family transcriptional regulator [Actibacterium sp. MT2.3-13A]